MGAGYKIFVAGPLTSADVQNYLMKQSNIVITSTTRPAAPEEGMEIYETDTRLKAIFTNGAWRYTGPGPLGRVASAIGSNDVGSGNTEANVLQCPFVAIAGRRYRVSWKVAIVDSGGGCLAEGRLREDLNNGGTIDSGSVHTHVATTSSTLNSWVDYVPGTPGNRTLTVTIKTLQNTGITTVPGTSNATRILVEDIGPA